MPGQIHNKPLKPYLRIVNGNWAETADKDSPNAKLREYETPDGHKGSKWEINYTSWMGTIRKIEFRENEYGEQCLIELDDAILTLKTTSRYFDDIASKLPNADLSKPINFHPYSMEIDGKNRIGVSVQQDGKKLKSFYWDGQKNLHGLPEVDKTKSQKKSYWKIYFTEVTEFLIEELKKLNDKIPKTTANVTPEEVKEVFNDEPCIPNDLPF